jgi:hypothetical protein
MCSTLIYTYGRSGTLWEGRFKSTVVDADNYLLTVYRYIELNPVRAKMVDVPFIPFAWLGWIKTTGFCLRFKQFPVVGC